MVDGLYELRSEVDHVACVVSFEAELYARYHFCVVDLLQQDGQLADDVVHARTNLAQTDDVGSHCLRVEVLRRPRPRPHELLLGFYALACAEDAVLDHELPRRDECFRHEERLIVFAFDGVSQERAREGLGVVELQICDEVVHLNERTDDLGHDFQLLQESILAHVVQLQRTPKVLGLELLIIEEIVHGLAARDVGLRSINSDRLPRVALGLKRLLDEVVEGEGERGEGCELADLGQRDGLRFSHDNRVG